MPMALITFPRRKIKNLGNISHEGFFFFFFFLKLLKKNGNFPIQLLHIVPALFLCFVF